MNTDEHRYPESLNELSGKVIGAAQAVSNTLGCGFLEKVYENSLAIELRERGHDVKQQHSIDVRYKTEIVGQYVMDMLVDEAIVVELKALPSVQANHEAQCLNYLRASGRRLALLLNFGRPRLEIRRVICG